MVSPAQRRKAVGHAREALEVSERRACRTLGQARSTQRYEPRGDGGEQRLVKRLHELVRAHPRYGYRRIAALLRAEGWRANAKRVYRLWRSEGFRVPRRKRKRRRLGASANACHRLRASGPNDVWAWDFVHDRTADGRALKWLTLVDEHTRECLLVHPERSITSGRAAQLVGAVMAERGAPAHMRSDNGPEFIARGLRSWLAQRGVGTLYVRPGAPWENGCAESLNARVRDELIDVEEFNSALEAKVVAQAWRHEYNTKRPHSALGYRTPAAFAAELQKADLPGPKSPSPLGGRGNGQTPGHQPQTLISTGT